MRYEYTSVHDEKWGEFIESCNHALQGGWTAQGGIAVTVTPSHYDGELPYFSYAQAFIREVPEEGKEQ